MKKKPIALNDDNSFAIYIFRVMKELKPEMTNTKNSVRVLNQIMINLFQQIMEESRSLKYYSRQSTIQSREIQAAVKMLYPGELKSLAIKYGQETSPISIMTRTIENLETLQHLDDEIFGKQVNSYYQKSYQNRSPLLFSLNSSIYETLHFQLDHFEALFRKECFSLLDPMILLPRTYVFEPIMIIFSFNLKRFDVNFLKFEIYLQDKGNMESYQTDSLRCYSRTVLKNIFSRFCC